MSADGRSKGEASEKSPLVSVDMMEEAKSESLARSEWYNSASILMAEVMGTGLLALPHAMSKLGWLLGLSSSLGFGVASTYSAVLLARVKNDFYPHAESYGDLADETGGRAFGSFTRIAVLLTWSALLPYYMLACADSLHALAPGVSMQTWQWALVVAALLVVPLQLRTLHQVSFLCLASTAAVIGAIAIILITLLLQVAPAAVTAIPAAIPAGAAAIPEAVAALSPHSPRRWLPDFSRTSLLSVLGHVSSFVFAYQGHSVILEMMREMKDPRHFARAALAANALMISVYTGTSVLGCARPAPLHARPVYRTPNARPFIHLRRLLPRARQTWRWATTWPAFCRTRWPTGLPNRRSAFFSSSTRPSRIWLWASRCIARCMRVSSRRLSMPSRSAQPSTGLSSPPPNWYSTNPSRP